LDVNWQEKITRWCARSERSQAEVLKRLKEWEVPNSEANSFLLKLEGLDFVNQPRFLSAFTHDHFHLKQWGPYKIGDGLSAKGCSSSEISSALSVLTPDIVLEKLTHVLNSRLKTHPSDLTSNRPRLIRHLQSRGFSLEMILSSIKSI